MKFVRDLPVLSLQQHGCVATIGNFDGVHRGHQAILRALREQAQQLDLPSVLVTFEPHPKEFFFTQSDQAKIPARLTRLREKLAFLQAFGLDYVVCLRFHKALAKMAAQDFIDAILIQGLHVKSLLVGQDFRFGYQRAGDYKQLEQAGRDYDFQLHALDLMTLDDLKISSTQIRLALQQGDFTLAQRLLGRTYTMQGHVVHGDKRGRKLGFATANILLARRVTSLHGVFAVKLHGLATKALPGMANIGTRPTLEGTKMLLEVHLFDFDAMIYGVHVEVEFIAKIRDEKRFASVGALKSQLQCDAKAVKELLNDRL